MPRLPVLTQSGIVESLQRPQGKKRPSKHAIFVQGARSGVWHWMIFPALIIHMFWADGVTGGVREATCWSVCAHVSHVKRSSYVIYIININYILHNEMNVFMELLYIITLFAWQLCTPPLHYCNAWTDLIFLSFSFINYDSHECDVSIFYFLNSFK